MAAEDVFERGGRRWVLRRHPDREGSSLRAWDAADLLLLEAVERVQDEQEPILLVGDRQGALATVLAARQRTSLMDSAGGRVAVERNLQRNDLAQDGLSLRTDAQLDSTQHALVVMKVPRSNDMLELRLRRLASLAPVGTPVLAGVMARHLSKGALRLFERFMPPVEVSRAVRKARVVRAVVGSPARRSELRTFDGPEGLKLTSWKPVFGAGGTDKGAAKMLPTIPTSGDPLRIVDFGSGTGLLGLVAAARCPRAELTFVDDSALAVDSSERSWSLNRDTFGDRTATFLHADNLAALAAASVDLVLCNPPFHQAHTVTRQSAAAMFLESKRVLRAGGHLLVVGNRHLSYDTWLKRVFGSAGVVVRDQFFTVVRATR